MCVRHTAVMTKEIIAPGGRCTWRGDGVHPRITVREGQGVGAKVRKGASTIALGYIYGPLLERQAVLSVR